MFSRRRLFWQNKNMSQSQFNKSVEARIPRPASDVRHCNSVKSLHPLPQVHFVIDSVDVQIWAANYHFV
jgi:hypothetical protein